MDLKSCIQIERISSFLKNVDDKKYKYRSYCLIIPIMLLEHLIYSTAFAIVAGMIHYRLTGRDYSWIIIASAYAPDMDMISNSILDRFGIMRESMISHGDFHNLTVLIIFAFLVSALLQVKRYNFIETFIFAGSGFGAHMFEDALVYNPGYAFLSPLSDRIVGIGIINYYPDLYHLADSRVLLSGIIAVLLLAFIRVAYEGKNWIKKEVTTVIIFLMFFITMIVAFNSIDDSLIDEITYSRNGVFLDNWHFGDNSSWDTATVHSGNHSGNIYIEGNESKISGMWRTRSMPLLPDTTYVFSSWGKTEGAYGTNTPAIRLVELDSSKSWIRQTNLIFDRGTNDWTQKKVTVRTTNDTRYGYVYANIWQGYGTFWFDDIGLFEKGSNENLMYDPGIEKGYVLNVTSTFN